MTPGGPFSLMNANEHPIYIVEANHLAAQLIHGLLSNGSVTNIKIIDSRTLDRSKPIDLNQCLLIVDRTTISSALLTSGVRLRAIFPNSDIIVIADREFGTRVHQMFRRWVVGVIDYTDLQQLPFVALRAMTALSEKRETGLQISLGSRFDLLQNTQFSRREMEILELLCLRLSNKEIAGILKIQAGTVKFHVSNIFSKLGLRRRRDLFSQIEGLVSDPGDLFSTDSTLRIAVGSTKQTRRFLINSGQA